MFDYWGVINGIDPSVIPLMLRPEKKGCIIRDHWTVISADLWLCFIVFLVPFCKLGISIARGGFKIVTVGSQLFMSSWFQGFFPKLYHDIQIYPASSEFLVKLVVFPQYPDFYWLPYHLLFQALHISIMVKPTNRMFGTAWAPGKQKASTGLAFLYPNASKCFMFACIIYI